MESVYVETTVVSYLVARPSRDLIVAAHQQATQDWWLAQRSAFACYVSQIVLDEASGGDRTEVAKRLAAVSTLPVLSATDASEGLARELITRGVIPPRAAGDAAHIAVAAAHGIDYLLTWNCRHLANAQIKRRVAAVCQRLGAQAPVICTPEELMGE